MFVVKNFPPLIGGDGTYVMNIAKRLKNEEVVVVGCSEKDVMRETETYRFYGSGMIGIKSLNANLFLRIITYMKLVLNVIIVYLKERPDTIHTNALDMSLVGSFLAYVWGVRHVSTIHGLWGHCPVKYGKGAFIKGLIEEIALKLGKIDVVISVDKFGADTAHKICNKKVVYIPNGIDLDRLSKNIRKTSVKKGTLLFIGRIVKQKGIDVLIEALHSLKSKGRKFELLVVGAGPQTESLKNRIKETGLEKNVRFLGKVSNERIYELYQSSEIFVIPSMWEGLPTTLLEAWTFGTPVVTTNVGGIDHVARDGKNALVVLPQKPGALEKKIDMLLSSQELRRKLAENARKDVKEFDWNVVAKKISRNY